VSHFAPSTIRHAADPATAEIASPNEPCPGCGGTLYRLVELVADDNDSADSKPGKVTRCSGRCELIDGVAGVIAAPRR